jgi:hypothetical protein
LVAAAASRRAFSSAHQTSMLWSGFLVAAGELFEALEPVAKRVGVEEHRLGGGFDAHAVLEVVAGRVDQRLVDDVSFLGAASYSLTIGRERPTRSCLRRSRQPTR